MRVGGGSERSEGGRGLERSEGGRGIREVGGGSERWEGGRGDQRGGRVCVDGVQRGPTLLLEGLLSAVLPAFSLSSSPTTAGNTSLADDRTPSPSIQVVSYTGSPKLLHTIAIPICDV